MFANLRSKISEHFVFTKKEVNDVLILSLFFGFMLSFRDWGSGDVDIYSGLAAWMICVGLVFIFYTLYLSVIKSAAIWKGYTMEFRFGKFVTAFAIFFTFLSDGLFILFSPGELYYKVMSKHRLGKLSSGLDYDMVGYIGAISAFISIFIAALFAPFYDFSFIFQKIVHINLLIAVFSMLPLPFTTGFYLITVSLLSYLSIFAMILIAALLTFLNAGLVISVIITLLIGTIVWYITYTYL
jgi:hypothetical protein